MFSAIRRQSYVLRRASSSTRTNNLKRNVLSEPQLRIKEFQQTERNWDSRRYLSTTARQNAQYARFGNNSQGSSPIKWWDWRTWDTRTGIVVLVVGLGSIYYVAHLERIPETGRIRFMDISPKKEAQIARETREEILSEYRDKILPPDHHLTRHVRRIVTGILDANDLGVLHGQTNASVGGYVPPAAASSGPDENWDPDASNPTTSILNADNVKNTREWNLVVVKDDSVANAMASYGSIVVFTGILPVCKDGQGLAAVLGHEMGHVVLRHNSERFSSVKVLLVIASALELLGLDFGIARLATTLLLELPNSRTQELEADKVGLHFMAKACYDPHAAAEMHTRLSELEKRMGRLNIDFISTHPTGATRIKRLQEQLPEAYELRASSPICANVGSSYDAFNRAATNLVNGMKDPFM